jgi:hypothetical protein
MVFTSQECRLRCQLWESVYRNNVVVFASQYPLTIAMGFFAAPPIKR